jgi:UDP-GlcNAc:undecaprenyl-phosphate GlcNAc-1-phosphate transferase
MIPFLDAFVTVVRRIIQRKNPLKGDKGHLHHLLLERGWSRPKIAIFYWITTFVFGIVGVLSADKMSFQTALLFMGAVAFAIVTLNLRSLRKKQQLPEAEI